MIFKTTKMTALGLAAAAALSLGIASPANAALIWTQNFENNTTGWTPKTGASISLQAQNGGSDGKYAQITFANDAYSSGYADSGRTYFGGISTAYQGAFTQSIDIYVNTDWATDPKRESKGFLLDMSPANDGTGSPSYSYNYGAETGFYFWLNKEPGTVRVKGSHATNGVWDITDSGWYTFSVAFDKGAGNSIDTTLEVTRQDGTSLGGPVTQNRTFNTSLWGGLGHAGYAGIMVWPNGFNGDKLNIDNLRITTAISTVPEPGSAALLLLGLSGILLGLTRRKRLVRQA